MYKRLPAEKKKELICEVLSGKQIAKVCRENNLSRTIFYKWLKKYKSAVKRSKPLVFKSRVKEGRKHWKHVAPQKERNILKASLLHPEKSPLALARMCGASAHGVWNVLRRHALNTRQFREAYIYRNGKTLIPETPTDVKWMAMKRYENGEKVSSIVKDLKISRVLFYRMLKRYKKDETKDALASQRPEGEAHWRYVAIAPSFILEIIVKHPEYSPQEIARSLATLAHKKLLGVHGVYNFLRKHRLNTIELRISYAKRHQAYHVSDRASNPSSHFQFAGFSSLIPPPLRSLDSALKNIVPLAFFALLTVLYIAFFVHFLLIADGIFAKLGTFFSIIALTFGTFFFLYSLKYYATISIVLSFSRHEEEDVEEDKPFIDTVLSLFGIKIVREKKITNGRENAGGLIPDISRVHLKRHPFVSIHLAMYNEKRVIERLLTAATSMDYDNYEVIVADDSTDEEALTLLDKWKHHPKVKILHRESRDGYKGQALQNALEQTNKQAEFIMIFDADFIPYPDSASSFLKYFQSVIGSLDENALANSHVAAVQGYQWHVLNKSENWVTRGVRTEYAGSYVVERSANEIYGGINQISGSVYMIRKDVLENIGWGRSITEDFELTLRLYDKGYKVVYTPYVQAPSEAVSTVKRIIRQRMRWAEGHSYNIKKMFWQLMANPKLSMPEKFELTYLAPYYLQSVFFIVGIGSWFVAELIFRTRLSFWTEVWGWSLIFTNMFALPLMNLVGLFLEESSEKDYLGLLSFIGLSFTVAPFQGYAAMKGFLEKEEGPWFRTPKTGRITDSFTPGHFYRYVKGFFGIKQTLSSPMQNISNSLGINPYVALATANNSFNTFAIKPAKKMRWVGKSVLAIFLITAIMLNYLSFFTPKTYAAAQPTIEQQVNIVDQTLSTTSTTFVPTDNSLGLFYWDSTKYTGISSIILEVDDTLGNIVDSASIATSALTDKTQYTLRVNYSCSAVGGSVSQDETYELFTSAGAGVISSQVSTTQSVTSGTKCPTSGQVAASIKAARLIITQTVSSGGIVNSRTQVELGNNEAVASVTTSPKALTNPKIWTFTSASYSGTQGTTFIASVGATLKPTTGDTATACLWDDTSNAVVTNGCTSATSTTASWQYVDNGTATNITLTDGHKYEMRVESNIAGGVTVNIANAKIILTQNIAGGITKIEIYDQYENTLVTQATSTHTATGYNTGYTPANWAGGTFNYFYEATMKSSSSLGSNAAQAELFNSSNSTVINPSGLITQSTTYISTRSADITSNIPTLGSNLESRIWNTSTATTSISSGWLIIRVSSLSTPENLLLLIPLIFFLPRIIQEIQKRKNMKDKGKKLSALSLLVSYKTRTLKTISNLYYNKEGPPKG